ncbi:Leucine aminopeptidase 1 [Colletotrichum gloeosporioides]|uniref:Peptide hydrolase n=1 Tax=Colletotrichum gloeosporioides TaxID=474922 RepID=A0A8H4CM72_COLGL|nr:Leucine aminopeptidase 1 [Colletotrichum gloeosporioides]KAF3806513.1 Leucine aminopeptidase 1 [Colletotrichum gloeosporioides]
MKVAKASLLAILAHSATARFVADDEINRVQLYPAGSEPEKYLIELAHGDTRWVTEEEKWELRRNGNRFFDITDHQDFGKTGLRTGAKAKPVFPEKCTLQDKVKPLIKDLDKSEIQKNLEKFTSFHTRYYKSDYGRQSSEWLLSKINSIIKDAGADKHVSAAAFPHTWQQSSIIVTIPGKSNRTVVIGAHQDSINLWLPSILAAPGADDDGSGSMTILEVLRTLLKSKDVVEGKADNTIEFHWYSAEEGGLLGSQAIFKSYEQDGRDVKAMLQQDMTGFVQRTLDAGKPESVGVITDFVDAGLTDFIKKVIVEYCKIPFTETKCGYACSDHASASKAGYPSAFVIESAFEDSDQHIHSVDDLIKYLSFDHMLEHAKMTLGLVYELGFADFPALEKKSETVSEEL